MKNSELVRCSVMAFLCALPGLAHVAPEADYIAAWCAENNGQSEVRMPDKSRADCITKTHAIEVEKARKFKEAIGQSLHYSRFTGLDPGVVLIVEKPTDWKYAFELSETLRHWNLPIKIWVVE